MNKLMNKFIHQSFNAIQGIFIFIIAKNTKMPDTSLIYDSIEYISVINFRLAPFGRI